MKKIDLHIHTKSSVSDEEFEFDMSVLKSYIKETNLDGISITNHNLFDKGQYNLICKSIEIPVFPGVEVDIEGCHILVIAPKEQLKRFDSQCSKLEMKIKNELDCINYEEFIEIFDNYREYILIPHYENKKPHISLQLLRKFGDFIKTGEVSNPKRWYLCQESDEKLVPVIFSDIRIKKNLSDFPSILTYIDCDEINFNNLKLKLSHKDMVRLNMTNQKDEFVIYGEVNASDKLNLILGKRSTGKTHLLNSVAKSYPQDRVKYIEQFQIVKSAEEEAFKEFINKENSILTKNYLKTLDEYMENISNIDYLENEKNLDLFVTTLKSYAEEEQLDNAYSKCALFSEEEYSKQIDSSPNKLIDSVRQLLDNTEYKDVIEEFINRQNLINLLQKLLLIKKGKDINKKLIEITNKLIIEIKSLLARKASRTQIHEIDFIELAKEIFKINLFDKIIKKILNQTNISELSEEIGRFRRVVTRRKYANSSDLKNYNRIGQVKLANLIENYYNKDNYFMYIKELQKENSSFVKGNLLVCLDYEIQNEKNKAISGGERAEYLLVKEIQMANKYDVLLIDEPEASFDNAFLHDYIKNYIKDVSRNTTTFISTHNNSLGSDIFPEKLIYTTYNEELNEFEIYSGKYGAEVLLNKNGKQLYCSDIVYTTLEAGEKNYKDRSEIYESLKNK